MLQVMGQPQEPVVKVIKPKFHNHNLIDFAPEHLHQKLSGRNLLTCLLMRARFSVTDSSSESYSVQKTQSKDSSSRRTLLQRLNIQASVQIKKNLVDIVTTRILDYYILPFAELLRENYPRFTNQYPKEKLPPVVSIAEDGTAIVGQREYDKRTNRVIGFSLPLRCNGFPDSLASSVRTAEDIVNLFEKYERAAVVITVMAQTMDEQIPAIRIASFCSNNRFTADDVKHRANYIEAELNKLGIRMLTYSADGDSREMKMMRQVLNLGALPPSLTTKKGRSAQQIADETGWLLKRQWDFFAADVINSAVPVQDTVHIGAKFRTRLLKRDRATFLTIGKGIASVSDLEQLLTEVTKGQHHLKNGDLNLHDKMNYDAVRRLCDPCVTDILCDKVAGSEVTCFYLKLMRLITASYLDKSLSPLDRIYGIWYSCLALRYWRHWLQENGYKLDINFITLNAYMCVEINAHSLVLISRRLRENGTPHLFRPWHFGSQSCESFFRLVRSLTSTESTQVNLSGKGFFSRSERADAANQLLGEGENDGVYFPRFTHAFEDQSQDDGKNISFNLPSHLPSDEEIERIIRKAMVDVDHQFQLLGVKMRGKKKFMFNQELVQRINVSRKDKEHPAALIDSNLLLELDDSGAEETAVEENVQPCPDAGDEYDIDVLKSLGMAQLRDFSHLVSRQLESSAFASIICNNGSQIVVKKARSCGFVKIQFGD
ncbi:uncharacterized protein LOC116931101 [Daphnia magna]|uniref:uncharacterized protein LOC116931101 n=3 Tax=Daphnia magna TaxID=35525 RepID=UPI001E1BD33F|nr:uncharacterized protein LOC116931101 [Daphnia magna]